MITKKGRLRVFQAYGDCVAAQMLTNCLTVNLRRPFFDIFQSLKCTFLTATLEHLIKNINEKGISFNLITALSDLTARNNIYILWTVLLVLF